MSKSCNSIDLKPTRPYRCAVASEDYSTSFYEGPPFKRVIKELEGGNNFANCVRFSPDGKYFAVGNSNKNVYLFDGKTADLVGVIGEEPTHQGGVYSLCFSPDSQELLTVSADKTAKIWNVDSRQLETNFVMGTSVEDQQLGCLWQDDHIITVSLSGELKYLDRTNPDTPLKVIRGHNKAIVWVATDRKEAIFSGSFEGRILKWNASTGEAIQFKGRGHNTKVTCALYDANSNCLITAGLDDNVRFTDCDTCEYNNETAVPLESQPSAMAMASDGGIVVACQNELVLIKDGRKVCSLPWKAHFPAKIAVFGSTIISTGVTTNSFKLYNIENNTITATTDKFSTNKAIYAFAVSPDLSKVAVADFSSILVYNLCDNSFKDPEKSFHGHSSNISALGWSPDGQHLCSVSMDQQLIVWDYASESKKTKRAYFKSVITDCTWLDDNTVVTVADDCAVKQWSISF
uniref:Uncharacterized protein n=1 Tax=Ciona savignyi TaxID=51511 RepID=H2Y5D5_CIOSA